ncbi:LppU/SCO3897 family protein [Kitasatospora sp. NPDC004240]
MSVPPPQVPYGAPPPGGDNPYATGSPYGAVPAGAQPQPPGPPGYGYPTAPVPGPGPAYAAGHAPDPGHGPGYGPGQPGGPVCRVCGGFPAVDTSVRAHQGLIVVMRFLKQPGPFCRTCGTALVRDMSASTLVLGWWGFLSAFFAPATLLRNLAAYNRIKQLPPPVPGTHGPQLDPGVPLTKRPQIFMLVLPVISVTSMIVLIATGALAGSGDRGHSSYDQPRALPTVTVPSFPAPTFSMPSFSLPPIPEITTSPLPRPSATPSRPGGDVERAKAGDCLRNENQTGASGTKDPNPRLSVLDCSDPRAQYKVVAKVPGATDGQNACEKYPDAEIWFRRDGGTTASSFVLCLAPLSAKGAAS